MGINTHVYAYWGVRTEWNHSFYDRYEEIEEKNIDTYGYKGPVPIDEQVEVLVDGMGGEYLVFGEQLYDSGDARWGEMVNSKEIDFDGREFALKRIEYMARFKRLYPDHYDWLASKPWRLICLVHFS
jgi:hypothetical protein